MLTSTYLDLVHLYAAIGVMLSRVPQRKVVLAIELYIKMQKTGPKGAQLSTSNQASLQIDDKLGDT